jgi:ABC-type uncharacterized transport system substrate-binding protein
MKILLKTAIAALMLTSGALFSHPHVFISPKIRVNLKGNSLNKIQVEWVFDAMTTAQVLEVFDRNKNGILDVSEVNTIRKKVFVNLSNYQYYTALYINGKRIPTLSPTEFQARINANKKLIYSFNLVFRRKKINSLKMSFQDSSFYVTFDVQKDNISFDKKSSFQLKTGSDFFSLEP